jgi:multiple sugar transport system substrate-binding protein
VPDYAEKLVTEFVGGAAADVPQAHNQVMTKLYDQGMVLDLLPFATRDKVNVRRDYGLMGIELWDGKLYAMPYVLSPHAWYYNKTMVKAAGAPDPWDQLHGALTWDDLLTIAQATTRPAGGDQPDRWGISLTYNDIEYQLAGFIWSNGGRTHDDGQMRYLLDDPRTIEAVQFVYDLLAKHRVMIPLATRDELGKAGIRDVFVAGRAGLVENSSSAINTYLTGIGTQFEWDVFPIPQARKGGPLPVAYTSGDPNCVNAATRYKDEGWSFVRWLAGPQTQGLFGRTKLAYPALKEAANDTRGYAAPPPPHMGVFGKVFEGKVTRRFFHYNHLQGLSIARDQLNAAFNGEKTVAQAMRDAAREANLAVEYKTKPTFPD